MQSYPSILRLFDPSINSGQANSGQVNSGQVNSGQANSGQANSGQVDSGQVNSEQAQNKLSSGQALPTSLKLCLASVEHYRANIAIM
ncbi:MAG: hypothetical protein ACJA2S_002593 [Cyclobacteriaceae bacterium]|jgi:hypothetical protein